MINLVVEYDTKHWKKIAQEIGDRSDVQCRYRYKQLSHERNFNDRLKKAKMAKKEREKKEKQRAQQIEKNEISTASSASNIPQIQLSPITNHIPLQLYEVQPSIPCYLQNSAILINEPMQSYSSTKISQDPAFFVSYPIQAVYSMPTNPPIQSGIESSKAIFRAPPGTCKLPPISSLL